jgi:hypothetical protein
VAAQEAGYLGPNHLSMAEEKVPVHIAHPCKDYPTSYNYFSTFREEPGLSSGDAYAGGQAALGTLSIIHDSTNGPNCRNGVVQGSIQLPQCMPLPLWMLFDAVIH